MDDHHNSIPLFSPPSPLFSTPTTNWAYCSHGKVEEGEEGSMAKMELRQALLSATLDLESTRAAAQEELVRMEGEVARVRALLEAVTRERDEARQQCHHALLLLHTNHQQQQQHHGKHLQPIPNSNTHQEAQLGSLPPLHDTGVSTAAVTPAKTTASASSEESSVVSSPPPPPPPPPPPKASDSEFDIGSLAANRELPEKGRLLEAVMKAGPLLQNLLLAGPLPQWCHPPPPLRSFEIPPVTISTTTTTTTATAAIMEFGRDEEIRKRKEREGEMRSGGGFSSPSSSWSPPHPPATGKYQRTSNGALLEQVEYHY